MELIKRKIGELISLDNRKNISDLELPFYGINKDKTFMPTIATTDGLDRKKYKIISKGMFVFSGMQTGRDMCIRIGLYDYPFDALISPAYTTFNVSSKEILPEYLFMIFKSKEMDRYGAFLSDGSIRSNLDWDVFCGIELSLPNITIQRKYVDIYLGMQENLNILRKSVEQTQYTCEICMNEALRTAPKHTIGEYIEETNFRNTDLQYAADDVMGMTITKQIIPTKANMNGTALDNFRIVYPGDFVYNPRTHGKKIGLGFNQTDKPIIISWNNASFRVKDSKKEQLLPEYLYLWFCRSEWDREACFRSWGSSTEVFAWDALCEMKISVPHISVQHSIVNIYKAYNAREKMVERLENLQKNICPILVRGAIEEGGR